MINNSKFKRIGLLLITLFLITQAYSQVELGRQYSGKATYYAQKFYGRKTASGEILNQNDLTIAHRTLPFGTMVEIENLNNHKWVVARVNDRGPYANNAIIDLTTAVKKKLGVTGNIPVSIMIVGDAGTVYLGRNDITQNTSEIIKGIEPNNLVVKSKVPMKNKKTKKGYSKKRRSKKRRR